MDIDISGLDLLYLTLAVIAYATGATLWTYFARPVRQGEVVTLKVKALTSNTSATVADFFEEVDPHDQAWRKAPNAR